VRNERKVHQTLGMVTAPMHGVAMNRASAPNGLFLLDKALRAQAALRGQDAERWQALMVQTGGQSVMSIALARDMKREDYVLALI
jgi:hypothetical protein